MVMYLTKLLYLARLTDLKEVVEYAKGVVELIVPAAKAEYPVKDLGLIRAVI